MSVFETESLKIISLKRGKHATTKLGENCFPWTEVRDTQQNFDLWGRQTITLVPRYK